MSNDACYLLYQSSLVKAIFIIASLDFGGERLKQRLFFAITPERQPVFQAFSTDRPVSRWGKWGCGGLGRRGWWRLRSHRGLACRSRPRDTPATAAEASLPGRNINYHHTFSSQFWGILTKEDRRKLTLRKLWLMMPSLTDQRHVGQWVTSSWANIFFEFNLRLPSLVHISWQSLRDHHFWSMTAVHERHVHYILTK